MKKTKHKVIQTEDSIEALKGLPSSIKKAMAVEGKNLMSGLWKQALKPQVEVKESHDKPQKSGDLKPGEEINLKEEKKLQHIEPGINYAREIVHAERKIQAENQHETKVKIQEII